MFNSTVDWIKEDYATHPVRFVLELLAWFMSIGCTIWMGYNSAQSAFYILISVVCCTVYNIWVGGMDSRINWDDR
jgi:hypothetical protein